MGNLTFTDDILAPTDTIMVKYKGRNPFVAATVPPQFIRDILKVPGKDVLETDVRWDVSGKVHGFYGRWMGKRQEDRWTQTRVRIVVQGEQDPAEKTGWVVIELKGTIRTSYTYTNSFQKAFWLLYSRTFYNQQRRNYIEEGKDVLYEMRERYQRLLGILPPEEQLRV